MDNVSFAASFSAGLLSFLSPCVLPLASTYLLVLAGANLTGHTAAERSAGISRARMVFSAICFVAGFTVVFTLMGAILSSVFFLLEGARKIVNLVSGLLVILLGAQILFNFIPFLNYEKKADAALLSPFLTGLAFGAGWTPCVGPILGAILFLASQDGQVLRAALSLFFYSLGLGLPFILAAVFWGGFLRFASKIRRFIPALHLISGILVICAGVFMLTGQSAMMPALFFKAGYALVSWAESGSFWVRLAPCLVFLSAVCLFALPCLLKNHRPPGPAKTVCAVFCLLLAALSLSGALNLPALLSQWLVFSGG